MNSAAEHTPALIADPRRIAQRQAQRDRTRKLVVVVKRLLAEGKGKP